MNINYNITSDTIKLPNAMGFNNLPRYRWYAYKEGFSANLVELAIKESGTTQNDLIIDPFNGSGSVTLYSSLNGFKSIGFEVNPFVAFMSEAKISDITITDYDRITSQCLKMQKLKMHSNLLNYSTFSECNNSNKWLFNSEVLNTFESLWHLVDNENNGGCNIIKLALIDAAMNNCNAVKDGKCLKYKKQWKERNYSKSTFLKSLEDKFSTIREDLLSTQIVHKAIIKTGDSRTLIEQEKESFKLCITSPPYLNSFDYTDVYRPELFLGKFIKTSEDLYAHRKKTIRSHVEVKLELPTDWDLGNIFQNTYNEIYTNKSILWNKQIPIMIHAYFEDIKFILSKLFNKGRKDSEIWLIVSTSAYINIEIPVDLIIAEISTKVGWYLKEIKVLRYINKRRSKYSPDISELRESLIILKHSK